MFTLMNMNKPNTHLAIKIESPTGDSVELTIGPMISKRNREELIPERQYELLNSYLAYKGPEFQHDLFVAILGAEQAIEESCFSRGLSSPPIKPLRHILDMFDMKDVDYYVREVYKLVPPENLKETFDPRIESDGLGTRTQTFLIQDYYDIASITIPVKVVSGLLGHYAIRKDNCMAVIHKEYILYGLIADHPIMDHPAVHKLRDWAVVLINLTVATTAIESVTVIEKQIPSSELPNYIVAVVMLQKLSIAALVTDNKERNVITRIYNYIINKLKTNGGSGSKIREKKPLTDTDSTSGDKESILESYRIVSNLTVGTEVELNWYAGDINILKRDLKVPVDDRLVQDMVEMNQCFINVPVSKEQIILSGYIFKNILDPRSLPYLNIDGIINILSLGFAALWATGHKEIALMLTAKQITSNSDDIDINVTPNVRLDPKLKERLCTLYPYEKRLSPTKTESVIETSITELTYGIFKHRWIPNAPQACLDEQFPNGVVKVLNPDIKNLLAKLIIYLQENV